MKKFTKTVAVVAAVSMLGASVTACSKGSKKSYDSEEGTYVAKVDMTDYLEDMLGMDLDGSVEVEYYLELEDGEGTLSADADAYKEAMTDIIEDNLDSIVEELTGMTIEDAADASGMSEDELRDYFMESFTSGMDESDMEDMKTEITYELDDDTIIITTDKDEEIEGEYKGDSIVIEAPEELADSLDIDELVFERE